MRIVLSGSLIPEGVIKSVEARRAKRGINGPLNSSAAMCVMSYIAEKVVEEKEDLLWNLISIAAKSKGRLRSDEGVSESSSPEAAIIELLLREDHVLPKKDGSRRRKVEREGVADGNGRCTVDETN